MTSTQMAEEINDACIVACESCPQFRGFDDDQTELVSGRYVNVANLGSKGPVAVVNYWKSKETIGGNLLWNRGYSEALPDNVLQLFDKVDDLMAAAIEAALR